MLDKNKENWIVNIIKENCTFPFVVIDNWYTVNEENNIWKELDFYTSQENKDRAENTIVAKDDKGNSLGKSYRFYMTDYYSQVGFKKSHISNYMYKQKSIQFHNIIKECMPYGRYFTSSNRDTTLISYYEQDDHYEPHYDNFLWTCLIWMVREPRMFTGGNFDFPESGYEIKLKNNRMIMFPCCYLHRVSPIKFYTQPKEIGYGKYTITHFYYSTPTG
jgi:hypothetical protein